MSSKFWCFIIVCTTWFGAAETTLAQDRPSAGVSFGLNALRFEGEGLPRGFYLDVAGYPTSVLGIVGQVTGNYKTFEFFNVDVDSSLHSFMGGVRLTVRGAPIAKPFVQALFGAMRASGEARAAAPGLFARESATEPALQLGGGLNLMVFGRVGVRGGVDYVRVFADDISADAVRFTAGLVFGG